MKASWRQRLAVWSKAQPDPTVEGGLFACLLIPVGILAYFTDNSFFFLLLSMMLGLIVVGYIGCQWMLSRLTVSHLLPDRVYATFPFTVQLTIHNTKRWIPSFAIGIVDTYESRGSHTRGRGFVVALGPGEHVNTHYQQNMFKRGLHRLVKTELQTSFPFGMFRASRTLEIQHNSVLVYPKIGDVNLNDLIPKRSLEAGAKSSAKRGMDNFHSLREFRAGDNVRLIHWRVSARVGKRMLKELDQEQVRNVTVVLDTHTGPVPKRYRRYLLERGVSLAATIVQKLALSGYGVEFAAFAPALYRHKAMHKQTVFQILDCLATLDPSEQSLDALLPNLHGSFSTLLVLKLSDTGSDEFNLRFPMARTLHVDSVEARSLFSRKSMLMGLVNDGS